MEDFWITSCSVWRQIVPSGAGLKSPLAQVGADTRRRLPVAPSVRDEVGREGLEGSGSADCSAIQQPSLVRRQPNYLADRTMREIHAIDSLGKFAHQAHALVSHM